MLFIVPTLRRAGAETQVIDLVNGLSNEVFDKSLLSFGANVDQLDRVDAENVEFFHVPQQSKFDFSIVRGIAQVIDRKRIDVIHCTIQISLLMAWLARRRASRDPSLVLAIHTTKNVSAKNELFDRTLYRWLMSSAADIIFVCRSQAEYWHRRFPGLAGKSTVIYNGVDTGFFEPSAFVDAGQAFREQHGIPPQAAVVTCIAGFRPEKGHADLLRAFAALPGEPYLLLAGDGTCRASAEALAAELGVASRVRFLGKISDVRPLLSASDVSVLASTAVETFSIAMLESMAMAVPTVTTDIGGLSEAILPGETGDLVPPGDPPRLTAALAKYLDDREHLRAMGDKARERVVRCFAEAMMIDSTERLLLTSAGERRERERR